MIQGRSSSLSDDGPANAIARWENEGGATRALPDPLSRRTQQDLLEQENARAVYMTDLDVEGALHLFHSYPWAIPSNIVE
jgi:hypothetical protein